MKYTVEIDLNDVGCSSVHAVRHYIRKTLLGVEISVISVQDNCAYVGLKEA